MFIFTYLPKGKNYMWTFRRFLWFVPIASLLFASAVFAAPQIVDFENPPYTLGNVNGQDGWSMTGPFDVAVVENTSGHAAFGAQSLRISNATTSGAFGNQTFSKPLANEAGESAAENGGLSGGTRASHFEASWDFASTVPVAEQVGLSVVASPDRGDGARMSWIQMADTPSGLEVNFYDYQSAVGADCETGDNFIFSNVASGLDRTVPHNIKVAMQFVDGPDNDVVQVYVDGALLHTGTSWEGYFNECEPNPTRTVDSILFRVAGDAAPETLGQGFLIDNISLSSANVPTNADQCKKNGWQNLTKPDGTPFKNQGDCIQYVNTGK